MNQFSSHLQWGKAALLAGVVFATGGLPGESVSAQELAFCFEDEAGASHALNSGSHGGSLPLAQGALVSHASAKFGSGSLMLGKGRYGTQGAAVSLKDEGFEAFGAAIRHLSIAFWIKPVDVTRSFGFLARRPADAGAGYWMLSFTGYKTLYFRMTTADGTLQERHSKVLDMMEPQEWIHIAMTYDEGEVIFYVNGAPWGERFHFEGTSIPATEVDGTIFSFFRDQHEGVLVDDVACFYGRLLGEQEIATIFESGLQSFLEEGGNAR